jgi:APA family basic amino acid/polyamine antiporter
MAYVTVTSSPPSRRPLGTAGVFISAVALVVSGSTLVSDFTGFAVLGGGFVLSLLIGMIVVAPVIVSTSDLAVSHPQAGGIYHFARAVIGGERGRQAGLFLALLFFGTFLTGAAAETRGGAEALRQLVGGAALPVEWFVAAVVLAGLVPNLCGLRHATWLNGALLALMLGTRWYFGLAGFFGWSRLETWEFENLIPEQGLSLLGTSGIVAQGLALGFWAFVGIEGACALIEEIRSPARTLPRGLGLALLAIFGTSTVMGLGVIGSLPVESWRLLMQAAPGSGGDAPHLAAAEAMFGVPGARLMAAASVASTVSTMLIAFAAGPRLIMALARDGIFFGRFSARFARISPRTGSPVAATLLVGALCLAVASGSRSVIEGLQGAAYLWFLRYLILHVLALINRWRREGRAGAFRRQVLLCFAMVGAGAAALAFHLGFAGTHGVHGPRALMIAGGALLLAGVSWWLRNRRGLQAREVERSRRGMPNAPMALSSGIRRFRSAAARLPAPLIHIEQAT